MGVKVHIQINPLSHSEFHAHLLDAEGVISNAGFELASECLHLGKKLLVKPLAGQFEQLSNALALQAMSRAMREGVVWTTFCSGVRPTQVTFSVRFVVPSFSSISSASGISVLIAAWTEWF